MVPDEGHWPLERVEQTFPVPIADPDVSGNILERAGATAWSKVTRWNSEEMWVVDDPEQRETFGIAEDGRKTPLPRCDLEVFDVIDLSGPGEPISLHRAADGSDIPELVPILELRARLEKIRQDGGEVSALWFEREDGKFDFGLCLHTVPDPP